MVRAAPAGRGVGGRRSLRAEGGIAPPAARGALHLAPCTVHSIARCQGAAGPDGPGWTGRGSRRQQLINIERLRKPLRSVHGLERLTATTGNL